MYGPLQYGPDWKRLGFIASGRQRHVLQLAKWNDIDIHWRRVVLDSEDPYWDKAMLLGGSTWATAYGPKWCPKSFKTGGGYYYGWVRVCGDGRKPLSRWSRPMRKGEWVRRDIDKSYPCVFEPLKIHYKITTQRSKYTTHETKSYLQNKLYGIILTDPEDRSVWMESTTGLDWMWNGCVLPKRDPSCVFSREFCGYRCDVQHLSVYIRNVLCTICLTNRSCLVYAMHERFGNVQIICCSWWCYLSLL